MYSIDGKYESAPGVTETRDQRPGNHQWLLVAATEPSSQPK